MIRKKFREFSKTEENAVLDSALSRDQALKANMKQYSNKKDQSTPSNAAEGERVLLKDNKLSKTTIVSVRKITIINIIKKLLKEHNTYAQENHSLC